MDYESPIPSPVREPSPEPEPESPVPQKTKEESPQEESPPETGERRRIRRRKLVPKTFMDDEGYMGMIFILGNFKYCQKERAEKIGKLIQCLKL